MSYVDYRDVADVAATASATDTLDHGTFELAAPAVDRRRPGNPLIEPRSDPSQPDLRRDESRWRRKNSTMRRRASLVEGSSKRVPETLASTTSSSV